MKKTLLTVSIQLNQIPLIKNYNFWHQIVVCNTLLSIFTKQYTKGLFFRVIIWQFKNHFNWLKLHIKRKFLNLKPETGLGCPVCNPVMFGSCKNVKWWGKLHFQVTYLSVTSTKNSNVTCYDEILSTLEYQLLTFQGPLTFSPHLGQSTGLILINNMPVIANVLICIATQNWCHFVYKGLITDYGFSSSESLYSFSLIVSLFKELVLSFWIITYIFSNC